MKKRELQKLKVGIVDDKGILKMDKKWDCSFANSEIILKNGERLILSRRRYKEWKNEYMEWKLL